MLNTQEIIVDLNSSNISINSKKKKSPTLFTIHNKDSRTLDNTIKEALVDVTITSPPYFDLKDYGHKKQIGYGQKYEIYLEDLEKVFAKVYAVTKDTGSLWVIIDSFKRDGEIVPLPFDFAAKLKKIGWKLQDIIIWNKDKTVPWTNGGVTRNIFEYILVFSKTNKFKYYPDNVRSSDGLKKWWVKYPERYHPKGKSLEEVWNFSIPVQGSWGKGYIKHFCPLPEALVDRIINLTTIEGDVVLDPFSGSGTVPAQASFRNRKYIGFELNKEYIKMFKSYEKENLEKKRFELNNNSQQLQKSADFEETILNLRSLKLARVIKKTLNLNGISVVSDIYVDRLSETPTKPRKFIVVMYRILINETYTDSLRAKMEGILKSSKEVNKFGIEYKLDFFDSKKIFYQSLPDTSLFVYSDKITHFYQHEFDRHSLIANNPIISQIKVEFDEKDYE